ncbi:MAG: 30S ribosomal protein S17 [Thermoanaerobaculia bacterium]
MSTNPNKSGPPAGAAAPARAASRRSRKLGTVVSNKMEKTVVVEVSRLVKHARYGRFMKRSERFLADDRVLKSQPGDTVQIEETRPLSAKKRWRVVAIVTKGHGEVADTAEVPGSAAVKSVKRVPAPEGRAS